MFVRAVKSWFIVMPAVRIIEVRCSSIRQVGMGGLEFGLEGVVSLIELFVLLSFVILKSIYLPFVPSRLSPALSW